MAGRRISFLVLMASMVMGVISLFGADAADAQETQASADYFTPADGADWLPIEDGRFQINGFYLGDPAEIKVGIQNLNTKLWLHPDGVFRRSWARWDANIIQARNLWIWNVYIPPILPPGRYGIGARAKGQDGKFEPATDRLYHRVFVGRTPTSPPKLTQCYTPFTARNGQIEVSWQPQTFPSTAYSYDVWVNGRRVRNVVLNRSNGAPGTMFRTRWVPIGSHISVAPRNPAGVGPRVYCGRVPAPLPVR